MTEPDAPTRVAVVSPIEVEQPVQVRGVVTLAEPVTVAGPIQVEQTEPWQVAGQVTLAQDDVTSTPVAAPDASPWSVNASASSVLLIGKNPDRIMATITNDSTANLYVAFAAASSTDDYTVLLYPSQYYELPTRYTGPVSGVWASANGSAKLTEVF